MKKRKGKAKRIVLKKVVKRKVLKLPARKVIKLSAKKPSVKKLPLRRTPPVRAIFQRTPSTRKPYLPLGLKRFAPQAHGENKLYPEEEQGILPELTRLQKGEAMKKGEADEDIDTDVGREVQVEEDEIEPWEAGFAEGASEEGQLAKDALTGEPLRDMNQVVEEEINGKLYRFANLRNAEKFRKKKLIR